MIIHDDDKGEVEMTVDNNGLVFLHCPKCEKVWFNKCTPMNKKPARAEAELQMVMGNFSFDVLAARNNAQIPHAGPRSQTITLGDITKSAEKHFPTAFK
jgi:hypothetical protein